MNKGLLQRFGREYGKDEIIFCEHEEGKECFVIHKGEVVITKVSEGVEKTLAILHAGDIFGEMGVLEKKPRTATALAQTDLVVLALDRAGLEALVKAQPEFAYKLGVILSRRIVESYRHLANLSIESPRHRAIDLLLWKMQYKSTGGHYVSLSPIEAAEYAGLPVGEMNKVLNEFSKLGKLKAYSDHIDIFDHRSLQRIVQAGRKKEE